MHAAVLEYLQQHEFADAHKAFAAKLDSNAATSYKYSDNEGALERRWNTLRRLNKRNLEMDGQIKQLQDALAIAQDPTKRGSGGGRKAALLPTEPAVATFSGHSDTLTAVALHPSDSLCLSASEDGTVRVWDVESRQHIKTLRNHTENVTCLAFGPAGRWFATASNDMTVKLYETQSPFNCIHTLFGHEDAVGCLAWVGDADGTLVTASRDGEVKVWDAKRASLKQTFRASAWMRTLYAVPNGNGMLVMGGSDELVTVYKNILSSGGIKEEGSTTMVNAHTNNITCAAFSHFEADKVLVEHYGTPQQKEEMKKIAKDRLGGGDEKKQMEIEANEEEWLLNTVKYQPQFVASGGRDKNIFIYNLAQGGQMTMSLNQHQNWIRCVAFTASGKHLISCADDGLLIVFDLVAKRMLRQITAHEHFVTCISLHPTNKPFMVTGSADKKLKVWRCSQ